MEQNKQPSGQPRKPEQQPRQTYRKQSQPKSPQGRRPQPKKKQQPNLRLALAACVLVAVVALVVIGLVACNSGQKAPLTIDPGTSAGAWAKNDAGYYFNSDGEPILAATKKGIDVSKYQGEVDWEKAQAAGIDFAMIRCGFGSEWNGTGDYAQDDEQWRRNADECTRLGIPFGTYLYSYATTEEQAKSEAEHVARLLGLVAPPHEGLDDYTATPYQLSYPVYYDLEDKSITGLYPDEMAHLTEVFFDRLKELGYKGEEGIYASINWTRGRLTGPAFDRWRDNFWIARFNSALGYTGPYSIWQATYTEPGEKYGVQSDTVDVDFVMEELTFTGIKATSKDILPSLTNDTYKNELWLPKAKATATLLTDEPSESEGGQKIFWSSDNEDVATVNKHGEVKAKADGTCTITATLADGRMSADVTVRVGAFTIPVYVTGNLQGLTEGEEVGLADIAALKAGSEDSILVDAGGSLQGTARASLTGGMDMLSAFSAAGYDLHAMALTDFAYGTTRLVSDANMGSGPSLASNLLNNEGTAVFYRSTSWSRNRVTNGRYTVVERAGYKIGFFVLNDPAQAAVISASNGEFITARDWTDTAAEQITALQNAGCDAILAIASTAPAGDWQKALLSQGVTAIIDGTTAENGTNVLGADLGLTGVAQLDLVFTQGGGCRVELRQPVAAAEMESRRATWLAMSTADAAQADTAADAADPGKDTEAVGGSDTTAPTETADEAQQAGADAYTSAAAEIATLDADDQSILYTPLFTYAANPDANKTISFGNYLAALYAEIVTNDPATGLPEGASVEAFAGGVTEPEYGEITRGDLMAALPATARIQLVSTTAEAARALADGGTVSRVYQNSLTEYAPEGDVVYIVTDTATLAGLGAEYTVLRDYGDVFWSVRMNINDLTANFTTEFVLPEAPQYGVGRRG